MEALFFLGGVVLGVVGGYFLRPQEDQLLTEAKLEIDRLKALVKSFRNPVGKP